MPHKNTGLINILSVVFSQSKQKLVVFVAYFLPMALLVEPWTQYILFVVGGLFGMGLLIADEFFFYQYYNELNNQEMTNEKKFLMFQSNKDAFLATRSTLFLLVFVPLSFFVVTSTGSFLGIGLIMGLLLGLLVEMWQLRNQVELFNQRFWEQVKTDLSMGQNKIVLISAIVHFLILNLFFLR